METQKVSVIHFFNYYFFRRCSSLLMVNVLIHIDTQCGETACTCTFSIGTEVVLTYPGNRNSKTNVVGIVHFMGNTIHGHALAKGFFAVNFSRATRINAKKEVPFIEYYPEAHVADYENKTMADLEKYIIIWSYRDMKLPG